MFKKLITFVISFYQKGLSPLKPACCRFHPSCSEYARQSIERYGIWKGGRRSFLRLLRCHPFYPGGYDPVEPKEGTRAP